MLLADHGQDEQPNHGHVGHVMGAPVGDAAILETEGLGWTIGGARIVEDVTLQIRDGEFLAVIGPNGAGKTSLFNLLPRPPPAGSTSPARTSPTCRPTSAPSAA